MVPRRSIAIVDDDGLVRAAVASLGRSCGLAVATFASAEALLEAELAPFGCVLSDIQMPGLSGLELQRILRSRAGDLPFVVMTALSDPRLRDQAMAAGAYAFLDKPFEIAALIAIFEALFGPL